MIAGPVVLLVAIAPTWGDEDGRGHTHSDAVLLEEVVTTSTKKSAAESAQDVAAAVSVFGGEALAERQATDLGDLSYAMPNVALDGVGTAKGIANFSIRGQGIAGSIPSIDPTVGVFVDGVYLGVNYGVIMDMLDVEAVEVLRGPQGLLFGRNVTGGAVLLRSRRPGGPDRAGGTSRGHVAARLETGPEWRLAGSFERPLAGESAGLRVSGSYRDDAGWFENSAPGGGAIGTETAWVVRPVIAWTPADDVDITVIHEQGSTRAHGPATQNRRRLRGFDLSLDEPGYADVDWRHAIVEANRTVADGQGRVTNVFGWREVAHVSLTDTDSTSQPVLHYFGDTSQEQFSNELRYARTYAGGTQVVLGAYVFAQDIRHRERRLLRGAWTGYYGGDQDHATGGAFLNADFPLGSATVLTLGGRYTYERKDVRVATLGRSGCAADRYRCLFDFADDDAWRNVTPKVAVQRWLDEKTQLYALYTKGFRSGGYNLRNTSLTAVPGPFDEEEQDSFETGIKTELASGRIRLNIAAFHNDVRGMQRQVTRADVATGGVQVTANTADATIKGIEAETVSAIGQAGSLRAFVGYADGRYDKVRFDLTGDGTTIGDERLDLPRLAKLSWGVAATFERPVGTRGRLAARVALTHRDGSAFTDDNTGVLNGADMLDFSVRFSPSDAVDITLFGRNLRNEAVRVADLDLSVLVDSTFSVLREGRTLGLEIRASF